VDRLGAFLYRTDPVADDVARAIHKDPRGWEELEDAIKHGPTVVHRREIRALMDVALHVPAWVDWPTLDRGGALLLRAGWFGGMVLGLLSLPMGYASPGGNKPLVLSGQLIERAGRRLAETASFVHAVAQPGSMQRWSDGFGITLKVRVMHAHVRQMAWASGTWKREEWGEPINQHDLSATTLLFSLAVIEGLRRLGFNVDRDEADDCMQLWRYVGHLLGGSDELLPASEIEGRRLTDLIEATQGDPDDDSRALMHALLEHGRVQAKTPAEKKRVERFRPIALGLCRGLLGEEMSEKLAVPAGSRVILPAIRTLVSAAEQVRLRSPRAHSMAIKQGNRYWMRVLELGLGDVPARFRLH
jgi:hypothetical protein